DQRTLVAHLRRAAQEARRGRDRRLRSGVAIRPKRQRSTAYDRWQVCKVAILDPSPLEHRAKLLEAFYKARSGSVQQIGVDDQQIAAPDRREVRPSPPFVEPLRSHGIVGARDDG